VSRGVFQRVTGPSSATITSNTAGAPATLTKGVSIADSVNTAPGDGGGEHETDDDARGRAEFVSQIGSSHEDADAEAAIAHAQLDNDDTLARHGSRVASWRGSDVDSDVDVAAERRHAYRERARNRAPLREGARANYDDDDNNNDDDDAEDAEHDGARDDERRSDNEEANTNDFSSLIDGEQSVAPAIAATTTNNATTAAAASTSQSATSPSTALQRARALQRDIDVLEQRAYKASDEIAFVFVLTRCRRRRSKSDWRCCCVRASGSGTCLLC
jgi:hypothetical protein